MTAALSTGVDEPVEDVAADQLWLDLEAASRLPGRRRLLRVIAIQGDKATCRVESDTHPPLRGAKAARRGPHLTYVSVHRMRGDLHLRRYELVEGP